ncbi:MAG: type I-U CRISPR-associated helicase/endonuclease Cas3 [Bryobacteraceae bacterium]|jgi:CRISPR-associated endonuclease/helicase Cas3
MGELTPLDFDAFFRELHGYDPFPWQKRLAKRVCEGGWPDVLDLPTASGKTACIDVAVFAMAVHRRGPRRVFFVVDRRIVVDAAFERMQEIERKLEAVDVGTLKTVADRLRDMVLGGEKPLDTYQLRGGIYRDDSWVRSPLQPTLVASTVDQVGSRLLFRGYGVWDKTLPIHAGLVANDSLILLDEAHCSRPFSETLLAVLRYRGRDWATQDLDTPFAFVEMTATPVRQSGAPFELEADDYQHPEMHKRLHARKPCRLIVSKVRAKDFGKLAENLVDEAVRLADKPGLRRIAVMVNRVQTARLAFAALETRGHRAHLLIGRMRPIDRLELPAELKVMMSGQPRTSDGGPVFVVATQCLEVGADLDFDAMVTECASIDALLQRFGRLDRIGDLHQSGYHAEGCVVIASPMTDPNYRDPVYGDALRKTWKWLNDAGHEPDFGICSEAGKTTVRERLQVSGEEADDLRRDAALAPVLLPAHLDALVQTSPRPGLEPDVRLYLHGMENGSPEVQVVWRADLDIDRPELWAEIVSLCPPVSTEAMALPLRDFRAWLTDSSDPSAASSDIEGGDNDEDAEEEKDGLLRCSVLRWRGDDSELVRNANKIRPGDTLVLATASGGWNELGHIPREASIDVAERARFELRRGWILRLHPALLEQWPDNAARQRVIELVKQPDLEADQIVLALAEYNNQLKGTPDWLARMLDHVPNRPALDVYPNDGETATGWVLSGRFVEADAGRDESSAAAPVFLDTHLADVAEAVGQIAQAVILDENLRESLLRAARLHDCGKADGRFQALLRGGDPMAAQFAPRLLAKGSQARESSQVRKAQWARSGLPEGFRHELVSLLFAQSTSEADDDDLALHLIASHHGRCRPFAPVVADDAGALEFNGRRITQGERISKTAHRLDSGVADRFWKLTRRYGWWGLAYLESLLRLGDWKASQQEVAQKENRP